MDARIPEDKKVSQAESALMVARIPDLASKHLERVPSFKLPKINRKDNEADDLPDITPELTERLRSLWSLEDVFEEQPARMLVDAVTEYRNALNPYMETLSVTKLEWFQCWQRIYTIILDLANAVDSDRSDRFYSIPEALLMREKLASGNLGKADSDLEEARQVYVTEFDRRREELVALQAKIKEIENAKDTVTLDKLDTSITSVQRLRNQQAVAKSECLSSFFSFFSCCQRSVDAPPAAAVATNTTPQDQQVLQTKREKLLADYKHELTFKTDLLNEFGDRAPTRTDNYQTDLNEIKARIFHDKIDFYRCQSKDIMLHCLRLYVLSFRIYYLLYGEDPLLDPKKLAFQPKPKIKQLRDDVDIQRDQTLLKSKELFRQMMRGMKSHLNSFYCLQPDPDRCSFTNYLDNYTRIPKEEERDAILSGLATEEVLEKVFRDFETRNDGMRPSLTI